MNIEYRRQMLVEEVEALTRQLEKDGLQLEGASGQSVAHWAISARHSALEAVRKLDREKPVEITIIPEEIDPLAEFLV